MRLTITVLATVVFSFPVAAADFNGTWRLNVEMSKLRGNDIASETVTISQTGPNTYTTMIDLVTTSGVRRHLEISRVYDGKEHPATGVGFKQEGRTEISQQIIPSIRKITSKRDGKVVGEIISTLSPDGKVMTNRRTIGATEEVRVFERQ